MSLRIGMTYNLRGDFPMIEGAPEDVCADWDLPGPIAGIAEVLRGIGYEVVDFGDPRRLIQLIQRDVSIDVDLILNLAEMTGYRFREALAPALFELLGLPYALSTPDAMVVSLDKNLANLVVARAGVPVPNWVLADRADSEQLGAFLHASPRSRWMVKPNAEGSSTGISPHSSCTTHAEVRQQVTRLVEHYGQPAMVQEFLAGRELTVGVVETESGPTAVVPVEVDLSTTGPSNVFHWQRKEALGDQAVVLRPLESSDPLFEPARTLAVAAFEAIGARDCARVDLRCLDGSDGLSFMEINTTPGLDPDSADAFGIDHVELLQLIISGAARRYGLEQVVAGG